MNKPRLFTADSYHHLYNRGAFKHKIFFEPGDYKYFKERILKYKYKYEIEILCYCLMPNHFHIFVRQTRNDKSIGNFIGGIADSYVKTINKKYKRSGVLFEGPTKNKIVYDEKAFTILTKYILSNPVRANMCASFDEYDYSSAKEFMGNSSENITDKIILSYFEDTKTFKKYILLDEEMNLNFIYKPKTNAQATSKV